MSVNEKYSYKDLVDQNFTTVDAPEFNNSEIVGSNFFQYNAPRSNVFPSDMTGVTFKNCNLDNCNIPAGNTLEKCTNLHIKIIDEIACIVNESEEKIETLDHFLGISFWRDI